MALSSATADILVVGAGVVGLATAWTLSTRGARVAVLDRDQPGRGASWAAGGILSPLPPGACAPAMQPLLDDSLRRYPDWCAALAECTGIDPEYWVCGGAYHHAGGITSLPTLAQVRNPRLLKALLAALQLRGVPVLGGQQVLAWETDGGRLTGLRTNDRRWSCAAAVNASGAWAAQLGACGIEPVKGQMLLLAPMPRAPTQILISDAVYLIPRRDGQLLLGSTLEHAGFDLSTTAEARRWLMQEGERLWPGLRQAQPIRQWAGLRPRGPEGTPLITADPQIEGLIHASGHYRIGITLAPATAERVAALVLGGDSGPTASSRWPAAASRSG